MYCTCIEKVVLLNTTQAEFPYISEMKQYHSGRVALLGNLAHYMSPLYGQREAMEVEDAVTLAELLGDEELTVDEALEEYSSRRVERVSKIQEESLRVNDGFEKELGTAKRALNAVRMRAKFSSSKLKSQSQLFFGSS